MLAYVCETHMSKRYIKNPVSSSVYKTLGKIIYEVIDDILKYNIHGLHFNEIYIIRLVNEIIVKNPTVHTQEIITSVYFLTKYLINTTQRNNYLFNFMDTLMLRTEDLDINILTPNQMREIMKNLHTKRKLYLRIFLILSEHMVREKSLINNLWFKVKLHIENQEEFALMLKDVVMEIIICLTANITITEDDSFTISGGE